MRWVQRLRMAVLMLFNRKSEKDRLNKEVQFHLDQQIAENISGGMKPEEARAAALRLFGNPTLLQEEARSSWNWNWLEGIWRDLRYGSRTLLRTPGFSLTAILVMALGIGATTSLFTIVRSVLLRPLPFRDPDKLVMLYERFRQNNEGYNVVAPADFRDWRTQTHGFQDMAAWRWWSCNITGEHAELPEVAVGAAGSWNFFSVLGIEPALGRTFTPDEDRIGGNDVVILSWTLFQSRFGGDRTVIGRQVRLDAKPYTIVGVLPQWFTYPGPSVKLWVPYASTLTSDTLESHDRHQSFVVAMPKDTVSVEAATREVSALQYQIHMANQGKPVAEDAISRPMIDDVVQDVKTPLLVLMGAVGCMLLIACLNVSNLLVARSAVRRKEVAIRGALGASRLALIREQMVESLLICAVGGTLGLGLSFSATGWLARHWNDLPRADAIHVDGAVLAFAISVAVMAALLAGLLPAISATGKSLLGSLQDASRSVGGSVSKTSLRKILLTAEIALTVVLLVSAGLLFRSFMNLKSSNLGCATENVLTIRYGLPKAQYNKPEKITAFHQALLERVRRLPGVRSAGLVSLAPGAGYGGDRVFTIPEHPSSGNVLEKDALTRVTDPGYFSALEIPLIKGRFFTEEDGREERGNHLIVSKKFADRFFPNEDALGKHVTMAWNGSEVPYEIVGVVGDTIHNIGEPIKATVYYPILSGAVAETRAATLIVRTSGEPLTFALPVQKQVALVDAALPVREVLTMQEIIGKATASQSFSASLVLAFATLSLMLAAVGLYGVLSYLVTQRVSEIGIRMALGAQRSEVLRMVVLDGLRPVFFGLLIGFAGGAGAGLLIKSILYGTRPLDPLVFAAMIGSLLLTAAIASAVPALRACRIEPTQALRIE